MGPGMRLNNTYKMPLIYVNTSSARMKSQLHQCFYCHYVDTCTIDSQGGSKSECLSIFVFHLLSQALLLGNSGAVAGAVFGTLLGLALLAGVVVGVILVIKFRNKSSNYPPPSRAKTFTPTVKVVQPGKYSAGHRAPSTSTPSAPPRSIVGNSWSRPPKPVSRAPPPKPPSHAPPRPPPPTNHPAVKPHPVANSKPQTQG